MKRSDDELRQIAEYDQCMAVVRDNTVPVMKWLEKVADLNETGHWRQLGYETFDGFLDSIGQLETLQLIRSIFEDCHGQ